MLGGGGVGGGGQRAFHRSDCALLKSVTHLAILFADCWKLIATDFFSAITAMWHFNLVHRLQVPLLSAILKSHDKIAQPDWLTLLVIHGDECRESQKWAHLAIGGEFNFVRQSW